MQYLQVTMCALVLRRDPHEPNLSVLIKEYCILTMISLNTLTHVHKWYVTGLVICTYH